MSDLMYLNLGEPRIRLATVAFPPSSVYQFSRIAEERDLSRFLGLGLQTMTKTAWYETHMEECFAISM